MLVAQLWLTLWDAMKGSPPGLSVCEISQARIVEWVAIPFPRGSSWPRDQTQVSCIAGRLFTISATREAQDMLYFILSAVSVSLSYQLPDVLD